MSDLSSSHETSKQRGPRKEGQLSMIEPSITQNHSPRTVLSLITSLWTEPLQGYAAQISAQEAQAYDQIFDHS